MKESLISPDANAATFAKPSRKQRWLKHLKRLGWVTVWLATAIALFYAIENWRGRRAWNAYVAKVNARGDSVEPAAVIPSPVPDAENFALSPMFLETFKAREALKWTKTETTLERLDSSAKKRTPPPDSWRNGKFVDLVAWQTIFRTDPEWPQTPAPQSPAEDILLALSAFDAPLRELHEIKERRHSRFPIRYEDAPIIIAPHYSMLQRLIRLASLRSTVRLAHGDREGAYEDLLLALRLIESPREEPIIMAVLVRSSGASWLLQPLWEGMARAEWTETQLEAVEKQLAHVDFVRHFHGSLRGERNLWGFPNFDRFRGNPDRLWEDAGFKYMLRPSLQRLLGVWYSYPGMESSLDDLARVILRVAPAGWYDQNKVASGEWSDRFMASLDPVAKRVYPNQVQAVQEASGRAKRSPYDFLEWPVYSGAFVQLGNMQGNIGLARIAIALERHRLRRGELPETLSGLEPEVVPAGGIPHDPASGTAPHYKRLSSDRFTLYFNGWDGKDDGGILGTQKDGPGEPKLDPTEGDWVWPMPANSAESAR